MAMRKRLPVSKRAVSRVPVDEHPQLLGIAEGSQRPVNEADDLAEVDLTRPTAEAIYPPFAPRTHSTMRAFFSSSRMSSHRR
jgi:hypothetical protein